MEESIDVENSINIDTGGTYTDCYVVKGDQVTHRKEATTPDDLAVCVMKAIEGCANAFDISTEKLLEETGVIKYATTAGTNLLVERKGPRLGLFTTAGSEDTIFMGRGTQWWIGMPAGLLRNMRSGERPEPLIPRDMVVGLSERIDCFGNVFIPLKREQIVEKLRYLVDRGATGFIVSLLWSFVNPIHERMVKEVIEERYPESCLGSHPIFLSSDVLPKKNEYERTLTTILTGYLHQSMAEGFARLGSELINRGYQKPLYIVQNSGGMAPIYKTVAVRTFNCGPVGCLMGTASIAKMYEFDNVIMTDMGGTSFDIGTVVEGGVRFYQEQPTIDRWLVGISMVETKSIGAGGGSIAWINEALGNVLEVGPQSAGSVPGPVCYDQGGDQPTVTDADVILGYIDPEYYLGGRTRLKKEKALKVVKEKIAIPLGMGVEEAALSIKRVIDARMGNEIFKEINLRGYDPKEFVLFACGGAGPTHCCGYGSYLGMSKMIIFSHSSVFSAYGVSTMDLNFLYEKANFIRLYDPVSQTFLSDYDQFNQVVKDLQGRAIRDIEGAGFAPERISFELELEMRYGTQPGTIRVGSPRMFLESEGDVRALNDAFTKTYDRVYSSGAAYPEGGVEIFNFYLRSTIYTPKREFPTFASTGGDPRKALKGRRDVYWEEYRDFRKTEIYGEELLGCGNVVEGPAIIEAKDTTCVIPPGKRYIVDKYLNGVIEDIG